MSCGLKHDAVIVQLLSSVDKEDARLVSIVDEVLERLESQKLAWRMRLPPHMVGVEPANRNGYGVSAVEVHALGSDIVAMGFSPAATSHAVCVEDDEVGSVAAFSVKLSESSEGLGRIAQQQIKYGSLSCSHTNQFLIAAACGVETVHDNIAVDNRISMNKLRQDTKLADAVENGLNWLVLSAKVRQLYPELLDLVQHAKKNATGAVQRKENEIQLLVKIQKMAALHSHSNAGVVDWQAISNAISKRSQVDDLESYIRFVRILGGGEAGTFVSELDSFHKVFVPTGRIIPSSTFAAVADLKLQPSELCPWFATAVLKAQGACPASKVSNSICRYIAGGEINTLQSTKKDAMLNAESILRACRAIVNQHTIDVSIVTKCLGRLDTLMVRFVLKKDDKFTSCEQIGDNFINELNDTIAKNRLSVQPVVSPWLAGASSRSAQSGVAKGAIPNLVQYDTTGKALGGEQLALQAAGKRCRIIDQHMESTRAD